MQRNYFSTQTYKAKMYRVALAKAQQLGNMVKTLIILFVLLAAGYQAQGQTTTYETIPAGSFIVNMGVTPQTVANGLKPYGLLYALLEQQVLVYWAINPEKEKDGIDFSHAGMDYRGGPFIVKAEYRNATIDALIASWQAQGVVGITNTSPINNVPVYLTFTWVPIWVLNKQNGSLSIPYFANAGIPASAHGGINSNLWKLPVDLDCCDDLFIMPHADPVWASHQRLVSWNSNVSNPDPKLTGCKGAIWNACHSPSALENMVNLADRPQQGNFLTIKDPAWTGITGVWAPSNSLILWGSHANGSPPYTFNSTNLLQGQPYNFAADPIAQYMGTIDAATLNGSEQIYMPRQGTVSTNPSFYESGAIARWRPETKILVYDETQANVTTPNLTTLQNVAAVMVYGRGFGDPLSGNVMHQAGHSHAKGTAPANVAAQRAFFNFGFFALWEKSVTPVLQTPPSVIYADETSINLGYQLFYKTGEEFFGYIGSTLWSSSCGGTFNTAASNPTSYTPPAIQGDTPCTFKVLITDECGRKTFDNHTATIKCRFDVTTTIVNPCFENPTGGSITMTPVYGVPGYAWSYSKDGGAQVAGTGLSITDLTPGSYVVTVSDRDGAGCPKTFNITLNTSPEIIISATPVHVSCPGGTNGAINVTVSGGTPGFTYLWNDGPTTLNRSGLTAGSYTLTVTDSKGCSNEVTVQVNQPNPIVITPTITPVQCYDLNNGQISLIVTGGTGAYTYLWSDGNTSQNRTGLAPGTYSVTVTDANNCTQTLGGLEITQPAAALSLSETHVNVLCNGNATGSIDLTVSGGTETYTYAWTKTGTPAFTASTQDLSDLTAGTYNVTVTDHRGCTETLSVVITQPAALTLSLEKTDPSCPPDAQQNGYDGSIILTVNGGTPIASPAPANYTYAWSYTGSGVFPPEQANSKDLTNVPAGTYTVVVTDANDCTATTSVTLVEEFPIPQKPAVINH